MFHTHISLPPIIGKLSTVTTVVNSHVIKKIDELEDEYTTMMGKMERIFTENCNLRTATKFLDDRIGVKKFSGLDSFTDVFSMLSEHYIGTLNLKYLEKLVRKFDSAEFEEAVDIIADYKFKLALFLDSPTIVNFHEKVCQKVTQSCSSSMKKLFLKLPSDVAAERTMHV